MGKVMLIPSKRFRFINPSNMNIIEKCLKIFTIFNLFSIFYVYGYVYAIKFILMVAISVFVIYELEVFFYAHDKHIKRPETKELIKKSYPIITALTFINILPLSASLFVVLIGSMIATFIGKLIFGGHTHSVFSPALVGYIFVTNGFKEVNISNELTSSIDSYVLNLFFGWIPFEQDVFGILGSSSYLGEFVLLGGLLSVLLFGYLLYKKAICYRVPILYFITFVTTSIVLNVEISSLLAHLTTTHTMFILVFLLTDYVVVPMSNKGRYLVGVLTGLLAAVFLRYGSEQFLPIIYSFLFFNMLTPMINVYLPLGKKKVSK